MGDGARSGEIAEHVLIFMVRGIKRKFKQPACYAFSCRGGVKTPQLKKLLKQILTILIDIGLKPVTTICDQAATNVSVIKSLMQDTKADYLRRGMKEYTSGSIKIKEFKIFSIFDPPHLLKGIRNNLLTKWLTFDNGKIAKWEHITYVYELDNGPNTIGGLRLLPHITDEHIYAHKIRKIKVKHAAQVLSQRFASTMHLLSNIDETTSLPKGIGDTAKILFFFDKLFDLSMVTKKK